MARPSLAAELRSVQSIRRKSSPNVCSRHWTLSWLGLVRLPRAGCPTRNFSLVSIFFRTTKSSWLGIESIGFDPIKGKT
jgi:hypothetical protein